MAIIQNLEAFVQSYPAGLDSVTDLQLSQNENGRQIRFTIGGVTIPAGSVATISGTKPDGVVYSNTGTIEGADTVIFDEDVQMTAVFGTWYAKIRITNAGNTIASARVRFIIDKDPVDAGAIPSESQLDGLVAEAEEYAEAAEDAAERATITYGSPLTASTAAAMTDVNRVYVYTGSESGYTYGNWYYYNGSAWVSGGIYNSAAVETDTTLTESGVPADAKATGDKIDELKDDLCDVFHTSEEYPQKSVTELFTGGTKQGYSIYPPGADFISLHTQSGYNSYWVILNESLDVFFDVVPNIGYIAVGYARNCGTPSQIDANTYAFPSTDTARLRSSDNNLPLANSKLSLNSGDALMITFKDTVSPDNVKLCYGTIERTLDKTLLNENLKLNTAQISQVNKLGYIKYETGNGLDDSSEWVCVYVPSGEGYIKYTFVHTELASRNSDIWRIALAEQCGSNFSPTRELTTTGEWECAVKISGRDDFSGGFLHGDEVCQTISFILDGKEVTITSKTAMTAFHTFEVLQTSYLYDPTNSTTVVAHHYSRHIFGLQNGEIEIEQTIKWLGTYETGISYLAMFPILKTASSKFYTDLDFDIQTISLPIQKQYVSEVDLIGTNILSVFGVSKYTKEADDLKLSVLDNGGNSYNKCYFAASNNGDTVSDGDIWKTKSYYRFII